jgi:hypothetical protein
LQFRAARSKLSSTNTQSIYWFKLSELLSFPWTMTVPGSAVLGGVIYQQIGQNFINYYITSLQALGDPNKVRMLVIRY